ncbi:DUF397 domain-containing protein [Streptomyces sp. NPDC001652]|uniref:DUF397 domain-containing protein n=1 Tax=unclassified Streptomyces TaxID=2593676 RepID=UPI003324F0D2
MSDTALQWFKSSYSGDEGGACVEVATQPAAVHVRDSKNPAGPQLTVAPDAWAAFVAQR